MAAWKLNSCRRTEIDSEPLLSLFNLLPQLEIPIKNPLWNYELQIWSHLCQTKKMSRLKWVMSGYKYWSSLVWHGKPSFCHRDLWVTGCCRLISCWLNQLLCHQKHSLLSDGGANGSSCLYNGPGSWTASVDVSVGGLACDVKVYRLGTSNTKNSIINLLSKTDCVKMHGNWI